MEARPSGRNPYQLEVSWHGLYAGNTGRDDVLMTPASVAHPAKMSGRLLERIVAQMQAWGWLKTGDTLCDPFGGTGRTALYWCGLHPENRAVTCEIEHHFVKMEENNKAHAERKLGRELRWVIVQGDSRAFDQAMVLNGAVDTMRSEGGLVRTSPPYERTFHGTHGIDEAKFSRPGAGANWQGTQVNGNGGYAAGAVLSPPYGQGTIGKCDVEKLRALTQDPASSLYGRDPAGAWFQAMEAGYVNSPGNIDNLGDVAAVTSPPYEGDQPCQSQSRALAEVGYEGLKVGNAKRDPNLARQVAVTSPPYEASLASDDPQKRGGLFRDPKRRSDRTLTNGYSAVTSPPFEAQSGGHPIAKSGPLADERLHQRHAASKINGATGYADNQDGQIGATQGETYADAVAQVYQALARAGVRYVALVVKDPTRAPKGIKFCKCK